VVPVERRHRGRIGWLVAALAAGLVSGGTVAYVGLPVGSSSAGPNIGAIAATVQRVGTVQLPAQQVTSTFTVDNGSSFPGLANDVTYRAVGTASATVALGTVGPNDVQVVGGVPHVTIPAAQLSAPILDTQRSSVSHRDEGFLTRELLNDGIGLSELHDQARSQLTSVASDDGVPAAADRLAVSEALAALRRAGITNVTVSVANGS